MAIMICEDNVRVSPRRRAVRAGAVAAATGQVGLGSEDVSHADLDSCLRLDLDPRRMEQAIRLVGGRGTTAQLCVIRYGQVALDRSFQCRRNSLFWIFSASKPYIAVLTHVLAERGKLSLDAPVSTYWPEFASYGKGRITVRHVLQHRSGLSTVGTGLRDLLRLTSWKRSVSRIEKAAPTWPPGRVPAYQPLIYGFILGEIIQRVTSRPVTEALSAYVLGPLWAADTYLGLPQAEWARHVPIIGRGFRSRVVQAIVNRKRTRGAIIPAAGISTTARGLARFYLMLLAGGQVEGGQILSRRTIEQACIPSSDGEVDRTVKLYIRWSSGFQLGGPRPHGVSAFGRLSSARAFGHNGSNCCIGWADPDRDLVFAYLGNRLENRGDGALHLAQVGDAVLSACR
jgi:CubicO group peptidase (beta-lactamase class C family)